MAVLYSAKFLQRIIFSDLPLSAKIYTHKILPRVRLHARALHELRNLICKLFTGPVQQNFIYTPHFVYTVYHSTLDCLPPPVHVQNP